MMELRKYKIKWLSERVEDFGLMDLQSWYMDNCVKNEHTARAKQLDFDTLFEFFRRERLEPYAVTVADLTPEALESWSDSLVAKGEKPATVNRRHATVKHFCKQIKARVPFWVNPAESLRDYPVPYEWKGIDEEMHEQLIAAAFKVGTSRFMNHRSRAIVSTTLRCGLRVNDVRTFRMDHLSRCGQYIVNLVRKAKRVQTIYIRTDAQEILRDWMEVREHVLSETFSGYANLSKAERLRLPMFPTLARARLREPETMMPDAKTVWRTFEETAKQADHDHISPHRYRHAFCEALLESTKDIRLVAQAAGHSDVKTTMRYTERRMDDLAKAIEGGRK
jgi:site-specific recombinase XerC